MKKITVIILFFVLICFAIKTQADKSLELKFNMNKKQAEQILGHPHRSKAINTKNGFAECVTYYTGEKNNYGLFVYYLNGKIKAWSDSLLACPLWGIE